MIETSSTYEDAVAGEQLVDALTVRAIEIDVAALLEYVRRTYNPDDVFSDADLSEWAEANGFEKA